MRRFGLTTLFLLMLAAVACQSLVDLGSSGTAVPDAPEGFPTLTPTPEPGLSRANPLPMGAAVTLADWRVEALETLRGDDAWEQIRRANPNNEPPGDNEEYLLVRYRVKNESGSADDAYLGLHVTGDNLALHYSFNADVVQPEPRLETTLPGGGESEGWVAYRIWRGESNLMVVIDSLLAFDAPPQYLALEPGAAIASGQAALESIAATNIGADSREPAPLGRVVTGEDWQVAVLDAVSGAAAWEMIYAANQFNDPPPDRAMYVVVRVRVKYIGWMEDGVSVSDSSFTLVNSQGAAYDAPSVVEPEPDLFFELYPGGSVEGYLVFQAKEDDSGLALLFDPPLSGDYETRYLSLGLGGR